jgi:hypothetical protein
MMVRRKSEAGELRHVVNIRRPTTIDIVSATATRRDVFAMKPAGRAAAATSDMTRGYLLVGDLSALRGAMRASLAMRANSRRVVNSHQSLRGAGCHNP